VSLSETDFRNNQEVITMPAILQLALDFVDLHRAVRVAELAVPAGVDWVEAGTPLIKSEGLDAVRELKRLFPGKTVVAEVVESHGCWQGHKVGTRFGFDTGGALIGSLSPKRMCIYALSAATPLICAASELMYAGVDANTMRFNRAGCFDVGLQCGGWGHIVMEVKVEDRT